MGGRVTSSIAKAWLWCRVQTTEAQTGVRWRVTCGILPQAAWHVSWFNIDYRNAAHYQPTKRAHVTNTQKARSAEASFRGGAGGSTNPPKDLWFHFFLCGVLRSLQAFDASCDLFMSLDRLRHWQCTTECLLTIFLFIHKLCLLMLTSEQNFLMESANERHSDRFKITATGIIRSYQTFQDSNDNRLTRHHG